MCGVYEKNLVEDSPFQLYVMNRGYWAPQFVGMHEYGGVFPQVWCGKGIHRAVGMRGSLLQRQQDEQLTRNLLCPLWTTTCSSCSGVLNLGQNKWGEKNNPHFGMWDTEDKISLYIFSFHWQALDTTHRFGMSDMVPIGTAQHRGCRWGSCFSQGCYH